MNIKTGQHLILSGVFKMCILDKDNCIKIIIIPGCYESKQFDLIHVNLTYKETNL